MQQFNPNQPSAHPDQPISLETQQRSGFSWPTLTFKKLRGSLLMGLGYLLSPLCWWNDLVFNLPVAYAFGYVCSLFMSSWLLPGFMIGYWLSNVIGIVLMQMGVVDCLEASSKQRNFKKDMLMGIATSTLYTLLILGLVQFKVLDISAFLPDPSLIEHSTALSNNVEHQVLN